MLKNLTHDEARKLKLQPFLIFQDDALRDMTIHYPITIEELQKISGVSETKAKRYGKPFVELISQYVEEKGIDRPEDFVMTVAPSHSFSKKKIIESIDRKMDFNDLAHMLNLELNELIDEIEKLVLNSGMRLNISYYLDEEVDPDLRDDIYDYFEDAPTIELPEACNALKDLHVDEDIIRLVRIQFYSDMAN